MVTMGRMTKIITGIMREKTTKKMKNNNNGIIIL
jgi:hypothetical protein